MPILTAEWVLPITNPPIHRGYVRFEAGRIEEVGRFDDLDTALCLSLLPDTFLTPGLINTHTHLEQSFPTPIPKAAGQSFSDWLMAVVAQTRADNTPQARRERCRQGAEELLRTGTTAVNDIASGRESLEVLDSLGLRGAVSLECFHPGSVPLEIDGIVQAYQEFRCGYEDHPRLVAGLSPHSLYNVSAAAWQALLEACDPPLIHTHMAEFRDELLYLKGLPSSIAQLHERVLGRTFQPSATAESPIQAMAAANLLNARTILAHCVHTEAGDRALLHQHGCRVAHCPRSNVALHQATLSWADWVDSHIPFGLGTDGRLSTENLDLRAEARFAMAHHGWSAETALHCLTHGGARVLGLPQEIGCLQPQSRADLVVWQASPSSSGLSPEARLLDASTQVQAVYTEGCLRWQALSSGEMRPS